MNISTQIPDNIKSVCRSIGYAAWLDSTNAWSGLPVILRARLDARQRVALAFMALKALDRDDAVNAAEAALGTGAGHPPAPFSSFMDEAAFWADYADPEELDAYCLASFKRMKPARQAAFLEHVKRRQAA